MNTKKLAYTGGYCLEVYTLTKDNKPEAHICVLPVDHEKLEVLPDKTDGVGWGPTVHSCQCGLDWRYKEIEGPKS
jgi:hypothetical protein